jgi:hypothetical protein
LLDNRHKSIIYTWIGGVVYYMWHLFIPGRVSWLLYTSYFIDYKMVFTLAEWS